jgi:hypothetical protein
MKHMKGIRIRKPNGLWTGAGLLVAMVVCALPGVARAEVPMTSKVEVTTLQSYSGASLPKPTKILVYDFAIDTSQVQVDRSQKIRPRHMITGDESPEAVAKKASAKFSQELIKKLAATGIPVQHVTADTVAPTNTVSVQGSFDSLRQGDKAERVGVGMGTGTADVRTQVDVHVKTDSDSILLSQFQTQMKPVEGVGAGVPAAAGVNPAAIAAKSTIGDRRQTIEAYASKTANAMAEEIMKTMAKQGWVKVNDKGEVIK